jgi:hypothetical protein
MRDDDADKLLSGLRQYVNAPRVRRALESHYGSPTAVSARVDELFALIVGALGWIVAPIKELEKDAKDLVIALLLADNVPLHAEDIGRRSKRDINMRQALCLWLASRQRQSAGLSGLWHSWETLLPGPPQVPDRIRAIVEPPAVEGGEQAYLDAAHLVLMAFVVNPGLAAMLAIGVPEAHRRLAKVLLGLACDRMPPLEDPERTLCSLLGRTFGVAESLAPGELIVGIRRAAAEASSRHHLMPGDATTMLTWIVGTCVEDEEGRLAAPETVLAHHMRNKTKRNHVHVDLQGGRNTLRDRIVRRLLPATQNGGADDARA